MDGISCCGAPAEQPELQRDFGAFMEEDRDSEDEREARRRRRKEKKLKRMEALLAKLAASGVDVSKLMPMEHTGTS